MTETSRFELALSNLDADIAEAKKRLAELERKREGAQVFLEYMDGTTRTTTAADPRPTRPTRTSAKSPAGTYQIVESVIDKSGAEQTVDSIWEAVREAGHEDLDRLQVRNSLHYLSRKELIRAGSVRGHWRWIVPENTEAPASTGASEGEGPHEDPSIAGGRSSDDTELRSDHDLQAHT